MNPLLKFFEITGGGGPGIGSNVYFGPGTRKRACPACGRPGRPHSVDWDAHCELIGANAHFFPDHMGGLQQLFGERMVTDLRSIGATGYVGHPIHVTGIESEHLRSAAEIPPYYLIEVIGRVEVDRHLYDEHEGSFCNVCKVYTAKSGGKYEFGDRITIPLLESWDGSDFVKLTLGGAMVYCTKRIVDLAIEKRWTGFGIKAMTSGLPKPDLRKANWFDELASAVEKKFPILNSQ